MENKNLLHHVSASPYQHGSISNPQILPTATNYYFVEYPIHTRNPYDIVTKSSYKKLSTEKINLLENVKQEYKSTSTRKVVNNIKEQNLANDSVEVFARITKNYNTNVPKISKKEHQSTDDSIDLTSGTVPHKNNPLFHYLKNKHTIDFSKIIQLRHNISKNTDITTLILKPQAVAVAGLQGTAIATPISRALVEKGTDVDIFFEPQAIAIAGPGGIAHAQSELEIGYIDS